MITGVQIGDVLAVRTPDLGGELIRLGAAMLDKPNLENHIAVMHHMDHDGTWWAIEARPGGVGWTDATRYLNNQYTLTNRNQTKIYDQRIRIAAVIESMLHTPYDWPAIAADALTDLHLDELWASKNWGDQPPAHVVCSSLAAWAYMKCGLAYPTIKPSAISRIQPADWTEFILTNHYE